MDTPAVVSKTSRPRKTPTQSPSLVDGHEPGHGHKKQLGRRYDGSQIPVSSFPTCKRTTRCVGSSTVQAYSPFVGFEAYGRAIVATILCHTVLCHTVPHGSTRRHRMQNGATKRCRTVAHGPTGCRARLFFVCCASRAFAEEEAKPLSLLCSILDPRFHPAEVVAGGWS